MSTQPTLPNPNQRSRVGYCPLDPLSPSCRPHVSSHMPPIKGSLPCKKKVSWYSFLSFPLWGSLIWSSLGHIHFEDLENFFVKTKNRILKVLQKIIYEEQLKKLGMIFLETKNFDGVRVANWLHNAKELFAVTLEGMVKPMDRSSRWVEDNFSLLWKFYNNIVTLMDVQRCNKLPQKIVHSMSL